MMIKVRFFSMLKKKVDKEEASLSVPENTSVYQLKNILKNEFPSIAEFIDKNIMISVNQEFADKNTIIKDGDEVALLPPFSGG